MKRENSLLFSLPPTLPTRFLSWCLPNALKEPVLGDLAEEFNKLSAVSNQKVHVNTWYYSQCLRSGVQFLWFHKRGLLMFIFSFITFVVLTLWAMWLGGEISMFWNLPSFLQVIPPAIFFAVGATSINELKTALSLLLDDEQIPGSHQVKTTSRLFSVMGNSALLLGVLMTVLGWVSMGSYITSENMQSTLGSSFGVSILTSMYAIAFKILCYVAQQKIQYKFDTIMD
jgi:hypothetical protein